MSGLDWLEAGALIVTTCWAVLLGLNRRRILKRLQAHHLPLFEEMETLLTLGGVFGDYVRAWRRWDRFLESGEYTSLGDPVLLGQIERQKHLRTAFYLLLAADVLVWFALAWEKT